jgi:hypothetical protein
MPWYKGNVHTHTSRSDGDSSLDEVVQWYAFRKYDWLVITDHHQGLPQDEADRLSLQYGMLVIPGIEVTGWTHVVGLGITKGIDPDKFSMKSTVESLQKAVDWIRDQGGVPILAHPNWGNRYGAEEISRIRDCNLFEVHNASPDCNTFSAGELEGTDRIWDKVLNRGKILYGVGSDDAHHYRPEKFHTQHNSAHGAEGWTYVKCVSLSQESVFSALNAGDCVASSGPFPVKAEIHNGQYQVEVGDDYKHFHYTVAFISDKGIVAERFGKEAVYEFKGDEIWVRARVFCSSGKYLWTQPRFLGE